MIAGIVHNVWAGLLALIFTVDFVRSREDPMLADAARWRLA